LSGSRRTCTSKSLLHRVPRSRAFPMYGCNTILNPGCIQNQASPPDKSQHASELYFIEHRTTIISQHATHFYSWKKWCKTHMQPARNVKLIQRWGFYLALTRSSNVHCSQVPLQVPRKKVMLHPIDMPVPCNLRRL
jgi:hypothetical protein